MFSQLKNIDTAFKHIKWFSIFLVLANMVTVCFVIYTNVKVIREAENRRYILYNGKVLEAIASDKKTNLPVELRDHVKTFHEYFFNLIPEDKAIVATVSRALYLADQSAKKEYDNLRESGYYNNMIAANISQEISVDSTHLDINQYPYRFICYSTEKLIRSSGTVLRKLVSQGRIRDLKQQTDNNPHGFLIQDFEILENQDLPVNP